MNLTTENTDSTISNTVKISYPSKVQDYDIFVGQNILLSAINTLQLQNYSKILILTDWNVFEAGHLKTLEDTISQSLIQSTSQSQDQTEGNLKTQAEEVEIDKYLGYQPLSLVLPAGEIHKNINTLQTIWQKMVDCQLDRKSIIINLGGGVVGDMGGFGASTYMRGIDFVQIPTTLLSMVDASVGGKLAIDFGGLKNNVGLFCQPKAVIVETNFIQTLPTRELVSGFGEIVKHGLVVSKEHFEELKISGTELMLQDGVALDKDILPTRVQNAVAKMGIIATGYKQPADWNGQSLVDLITHSIQIKSQVIRADPTEQNLRKILNFGHTIGHAFEVIALETDQYLFHGEAVSLGMVAESYISFLLGKITIMEFGEIVETLRALGLPVSLSEYQWSKSEEFINRVLELIQGDKKTEFGSVKWSLLSGIGTCEYNIILPSTIDLGEEVIVYLL